MSSNLAAHLLARKEARHEDHLKFVCASDLQMNLLQHFAAGSRDQSIFTVKAHVFHIDPATKRSWIPATQHAVNVSFFYDSTRSLYRIISVKDTKAIINSTITPNMTFTKTSQKFGQWSDIRANTVYGLGFCSEPELNKFIEKFQEVKEATRTAVQQKAAQQNGTLPHGSGNAANHTQSSHIIAPPSCPKLGDFADDEQDLMLSHQTIKQPLATHQRSQSLSGLQLAKQNLTDSPKHITKMGSQLFLPQTNAEAQLKYENDRLKLALAQSSANAKKWEVELQTLKNNNTRLTNALQESTANVEEWKKQLASLKDENSKMRLKILELEASSGNSDALGELKKELQEIQARSDRIEAQFEEKNQEIRELRAQQENIEKEYSAASRTKNEEQLKILWSENENLRMQLSRYQESQDSSKTTDKAKKGMLEQLGKRMGNSVSELRAIQQELTNLSIS